MNDVLSAFEPVDQPAFEAFCRDLAEAGFQPLDGTRERWIGPVRDSLRSLTSSSSMQVAFLPGWPLVYAHVLVDGLKASHAGREIVCLWSDDDPAQVSGVTLTGLWTRLDEWAAKAQGGFGDEDFALDSFLAFSPQSSLIMELPVGDLVDGKANGTIAPLHARLQGRALLVSAEHRPDCLKGAFYYRTHVGNTPRSLGEVWDVLSRRQRTHLHRGLAQRTDVGLAEPSQGLDFIALVWRRGAYHDVLPLGFGGQGEDAAAWALTPTPSDIIGRLARSGPDSMALSKARVLVAGLGSVGSPAALSLAESGVGFITGRDSDIVKSVNLVRHIATESEVGHKKSDVQGAHIRQHAPWCTYTAADNLPLNPKELSEIVCRFDLVLDCTGHFAVTALLAQVCAEQGTPLITVALYHSGGILRVRRQAPGDTELSLRRGISRYLDLPPEDSGGLPSIIEVGCNAPVHNAPPWASLRAAAEATATALDFLTKRSSLPDEQVFVLRESAHAPFNRLGALDTGGPA